ncbi:MAG: poly(A) polymerase [Solirubrobacteraceae bacterium]|nr:poly(A) polymerase [Solirubrobacteraceae bacterium]
MIEAVREALEGESAWLVGGAVRDRLLERDTGAEDLDLVLDGDVRRAARRLARATRAAAFELSDEFGGWRVVGPGAGWQVDLTPLQGGSLEADLAARDLTVNAMAEPLGGGDVVDPHGGRADLAARVLRMVSPRAFADDPLRTLRVPRLACELSFTVDAATADAVREHAGGLHRVAPERVFAELKRILLHDAAVEGFVLMDRLGVTPSVLPELSAMRGVEQNPYHHRDVHGHTLEVLEQAIALERDPGAVFGEDLAGPIGDLLAEPLADGLTRAGGLRLGALLHDAAKPQTRTEFPGGRVGFPGHDVEGAALARGTLARLRASERLRAHVAALTRHHLRLGFLVHEAPLDRRAIYRYLRDCEPVAADVTLLSVADRLATRGRKADEAIARHLALARELLGEALSARAAGRPAPLVRGDDLARALRIAPGPRLGELLEAITEAQFAGEVATRDEAVALARSLLDAAPERGGPR